MRQSELFRMLSAEEAAEVAPLPASDYRNSDHQPPYVHIPIDRLSSFCRRRARGAVQYRRRRHSRSRPGS